ncbi:MAG: methyltransferase domain-containing protein [Chloroflexota bacterium]|nr:methyltransferase domain-containing protein [Chloroflexota bacterium]
MWPELLDVLREPLTEARLELRDAETDGERILRGQLVSEGGNTYPIIDGVPRFVPSEGYTGSFGMQWNMFSATQLDSATQTHHSARRFDAEVGWSAAELDQGWSLEGGCGAGRFVEVVAARGGRIVALDYSAAIDVTARRFHDDRNVHPVQADVLLPPIASRSVDRVYSIGVLQHTEEPYLAMMSLLRLCKSAGRFAFVAYARRWYTPLYAKYLIRPLTRRLPANMLLGAIKATMPVLFPLSEALFRRRGIGRVGRFVLPVASYPDKQGFDRAQRYEEAVLDTFDMLAPAYDQPLRPRVVRALLEKAPLAELEIVSEVPIVVRGSVL